VIVGSGKRLGHPYLRCNKCNELFPIKSNKGISDETDRLVSSLDITKPEVCCPNENCSNHLISITAGRVHYSQFGKTAIGSPRWKCKFCLKTFSTPTKSTHNQEKSHKNTLIFKLLINKMPMRRICEVADIGPNALYGKIDFIWKQCLAFSAYRETNLLEMEIKRLYIGVDKQDFVANWSERSDRRNITFTAVASAENSTGYCFGMHLNFDATLDTQQIEADSKAISDEELPAPFRKYARLWLAHEYAASVVRSKKSTDGKTLVETIDNRYTQATHRDDIEQFDEHTNDERLPKQGMQIHSEYTLYAHFMHLRRLLPKVEKIRFFLDQDSGMRAACLGTFAKEIKEGSSVDAFFVSIAKNLTVDQKRRKVAESKAMLDQYMNEHPELTKQEAILAIIKVRLLFMESVGKWKDRWLLHPFPDMSEPEKAICYLTDIHEYDTDHLAWLYNKASLHAIDTFFMRVRRRLAPLERPIHSQSNAGCVWNGYAPYNPKQIQKLLDIMRVSHNFILKGKDGKTPAMRLGIAKGLVDHEDILYFFA
jgi:transposase-like protein/DNA-directed RNA polymerase specialized sigma24 family protein